MFLLDFLAATFGGIEFSFVRVLSLSLGVYGGYNSLPQISLTLITIIMAIT